MKKITILFTFLLVSIYGFTQENKVLWFKAYEHQYTYNDGSGWSQWGKCKHNITFDVRKEVITLHTMNKVTCMIMDSCEKEIVQDGELYKFYCRFNDDEKYGYVKILFNKYGQHKIYFDFSSTNKHIYKVEILE